MFLVVVVVFFFFHFFFSAINGLVQNLDKVGPTIDNYFSEVYCRHLLLFLVSDSASGATLSQDNSYAWILIVILAGSTLILASIALAVTFYRRRKRLRKNIPYSLQRDTEQLGVKL